jgi:hypothetical protein
VTRGAAGRCLRGAFLLAAGLAMPADAAPPVTLGRVRVQLLYLYSARLSPDIAPPARFDLWNVGAGEGSAAEPAEDALITVPLTMPPSDMAAFAPGALTITVRNAAGRTLATRRYPAGSILLPVTGRSFAALWVNNLQCAGRIVIEARYAATVQRASLNFACGE